MQNTEEQVKQISGWEQKRHGPQKQLRSLADPYDIVYSRFEWEVDPVVSYIRGAVTSYFVPLTGEPEQIGFELSDRLTVDSVKRGNEHLVFDHRNNNLVITRATGFPPAGQPDSLTVFYQGSPVNTGFGAFTTTYTAWQKPVLWTLSEPYGAAEWWPCKQTLNDKIDSVDIFVTVPPGNKVASNGLLLSETEQNGKLLFHWKHRYPIAAYLVAIAVTEYDEFSYTVPLSTGHLPVLNYVYPEKREEWERATPWVTNELQYYDSLFVPYPFMREKYGHAQFGWGGGMEHQTMSFMADLGTWLTSHELAHQWFGNYITCGSWSDIWLNEGFATYLTGLYYERFEPHAWDGWKAGQVNYICSLPSGSVYVYDTSSVNRIFDGRLSYSKAAMVLHMLRKELGDEAFFSGVRSYLTDEALCNDYALTADLQFHLEQAAGRSLDYFFTDWIYRQGYPAIHLNWNASGHLVAIEAEQSPSHPSVERFRLNIPVRLSGEGRDTSVLLNLNQTKQLFFFTPSFRVDSLHPDPGHDYIATYTMLRTSRYIPTLSEIQVFPNPSAGMFRIRLKEPLHLPVAVRMTDIAGREVRAGFSASLSGDSFMVDASDLAAGTYLLLLEYNEKTVSVPVVRY